MPKRGKTQRRSFGAAGDLEELGIITERGLDGVVKGHLIGIVHIALSYEVQKLAALVVFVDVGHQGVGARIDLRRTKVAIRYPRSDEPSKKVPRSPQVQDEIPDHQLARLRPRVSPARKLDVGA